MSHREQAPVGHVPRNQRQLPPVPHQLSAQDSQEDENYEVIETSVSSSSSAGG